MEGILKWREQERKGKKEKKNGNRRNQEEMEEKKKYKMDGWVKEGVVFRVLIT